MMKIVILLLLLSYFSFNDIEVQSVDIKSDDYFSYGGVGAFKFIKELTDIQGVNIQLETYDSFQLFCFRKSNTDLIRTIIVNSPDNKGYFQRINDSTYFMASTKKTYLSFKNYPEGYGNHSFRINTKLKQIEFFYALDDIYTFDDKKSDSLIAVLHYR